MSAAGSRVQQFSDVLRLDSTLSLTDEQIHQTATLLAFAGCRLPVRVVQTAEERQSLPPGTLVLDAAGDYMLKTPQGYWHEMPVFKGSEFVDDEVRLPLQVIR